MENLFKLKQFLNTLVKVYFVVAFFDLRMRIRRSSSSNCAFDQS